ncbi:MAG: hypothetical protein JKY65_07830 [Planctomycetes bacterium]|nr:hypothetical protein [Planctomycetota bacterium]
MADKKKSDQPTPKPKKKKGGLIMRVIVSGAIGLIGVWMALYSMQLGKSPHTWDKDEWKGFLSFSKQQVEEAKAKVEKVDWDALKDKITAKTRELWAKTPELEKSLDRTLARIRGEKKSGERVDSKTGSETPAAVIEPSDLEVGCEALRDGTRAYRKSVKENGTVDQGELKRAKKLLQKAQDYLERAHEQAKDADDEGLAAEVEGYIQQCNVYLEDVSKRETL